MEVIGSTSLAGLSPGPEVHTADEDRWQVLRAHARDARATAAVLRREAQHTRAVARAIVAASLEITHATRATSSSSKSDKAGDSARR